MGCILSFDVGTTGLKTIVISQEGRILKHCNIEYGIVQEQEGFAEQDPAVWWDAAVKSMQIVLTGEIRKELRAIGVSGQFQSLVMLDQNFNPLRKAILWCDPQRRGDTACDHEHGWRGETVFQSQPILRSQGSSVSFLLLGKEIRTPYLRAVQAHHASA
ncbi:MAG: FGGY family carbohydrate kinase [Enterocloster bolteae]